MTNIQRYSINQSMSRFYNKAKHHTEGATTQQQGYCHSQIIHLVNCEISNNRIP